MPSKDPTRACITCDGKLHQSFESGKLYESCGRCGLEIFDGRVRIAPRDADAVTRQRLGLPVQADELKAAQLSRRAVAVGLEPDAKEAEIVEAEKEAEEAAKAPPKWAPPQPAK